MSTTTSPRRRRPAFNRLGGSLLASAVFSALLVVSGGNAALASADDSARIVADVNTYRMQAGVQSVTEDADLDALAQYRADEGARSGYLQHDMSFWYYALPQQQASAFGELLTLGMDSAHSAAAWNRSGAHYPIMVGSQYGKIGVGYAVGDQGRGYTVAIFVAEGAAVPTMLQAPANVTTSYTGGDIRATWDAPAGEISGYTATLYAGDTSVGSVSTRAGETAATFANVARGRTYGVRVRAYRSSDGSQSPDSALTAPLAVPSLAPAAPVINPLQTSAAGYAISWNAPQGTGASVLRYNLSIMLNGHLIERRTVNDTSYFYAPQDTGAYSFSVSATNEIGEGSLSTSVGAAFTKPEQLATLQLAPAPPSGLTADRSGSQVQATWDAAGDAERYLVSTLLNGELVQTRTTLGTSAISQIPTSGSGVLTFEVKAMNAAGSSLAAITTFNYSNFAPKAQPGPPAAVQQSAPVSQPGESNVSSPQGNAPRQLGAIPTKPSVSSVSSKVRGGLIVRWKAAAAGSRVDRYEIRIKVGSTSKLYTAAASSKELTVAKLARGKVATVWLRAHNAGGWGGYTAAESVRVKR